MKIKISEELKQILPNFNVIGYTFDVDNLKIETRIIECGRCSNNCEIVTVYKNDKLLDYWGNYCDNGSIFNHV